MNVFCGFCQMYRSSLSLTVTLFLILLNFKTISGLWRYRNVLDNEKLFTTGKPFELSYVEGPPFIKWSSKCNIQDPWAPTTNITCFGEGFFAIQPIVYSPSPPETRFVYISKLPMTFVWYAAIPAEGNSGMTKTMRIWIIDPFEAHSSEISKMAELPSLQSYYLTRHFYNLGQFARVTLPSSTTKIDGQFTKDGYWEAVMEWNQTYLTVELDGQSVSFQHRYVLDGSFNFYWEPIDNDYSQTPISIKLERMMLPMLSIDPCATHRSIFMTKSAIFLTLDGFRSSSPLSVLSVYPIPWGFISVRNAILLDGGIMLHIGDGLYWRTDETKFLDTSSDIFLQDVKGIVQRTTCLDNNLPQEGVEFGQVVIWKSDTLYLGGSRTTSQGTKGIFSTKLFTIPEVYIMAVAFGSDPHVVAVVCQDLFGDIQLTLFNQITQKATTSTFLTKFPTPDDIPSGFLQMRFFESAKESLLLWNGTALWYSFYDDSDWGALKLSNFSDLSSAASGSKIQEIVLDHKWNLVVKMANNQMFYCKFGVSKLISVLPWVPYDQEATLYVNKNNELIYVTLDSTVQLFRYPLQLEILGAMKDEIIHDCPYVTFEHSMNKHSYYMDKRQEEVFWAQVVYPEGKGVNVQVLRSNVALLDFHFSSDFEFVHRVFTVNVTIKVKQAKDYTYNYIDQMINSQGMLRMEIVPNLIENRCNLPKERVSYFKVGCPPNRHIRVAKPWGMECEMNTFHSYTIPGSVFRTPQADDVVMKYDWNNHGCVFKMHYQSNFKPVLELYDGNTFVKTVDANFIVWETFGRNDYSYNTTMGQAGCLREALTWDQIIKLYPQFTLDDLRGPEDYQTCFMLEQGLAGNFTQPYDILNQSSSNHITFSQEDSAVYVFKARIVDPNYSFCDLTAIFAVQTYGIAKTKYEYLIPYVTLIFTFITLCILAYSYHRYVYIFRELQIRKKCD
ncbi:cation channel sperm-associated auxiliary subunit epsilon-like [Sardina pilchardus]|uniref:cation channel sperm-associated auxiliary subunit epsilon-like n=1 Tax=Sardina pilchardus TaxID=27697 RepID=UPI002E0D0F24